MMHFCMNEASIMAQGDLLSHIRDCAEAGISYMEIRKACLIRFLRKGGTPEQLRDALREYGVTPACLNGVESISFQDRKGFSAVKESCEYLFWLCRYIGCEAAEVIASFGVGTEDREMIAEKTADALIRLSDTASRYGVKLALEYMAVPGSSVSRFSDALSIIRMTGKDNVGLLVDTWHHYAMGSTVEELAEAKKEEIFVVHTSDCPACLPGTAERARSYLPGDGNGVVPIVPMLEILDHIGYDGVFSVETFAPEYAEMPVPEYLREAKKKTLSVMRKAGVL